MRLCLCHITADTLKDYGCQNWQSNIKKKPEGEDAAAVSCNKQKHSIVVEG